ncbi:sensor histidine kinase [Fibrella sp. WM1]|uniref:sensor histidine kinase n=1 Tax=Fibrella musci TaxID=3242485 RepID=UPI0035209D47
MTYEVWSPLFLGMVLSMLLANLVQWFMYRERIYGLYTLYTTVWAIYFTINHFELPKNISNVYKVLLSYSGYMLYLELANLFLDLSHRPRLRRWIRWVQVALLLYILTNTYVYLFTDFWQTNLHSLLLQPVRFALMGVGGYIIVTFYRSKDTVARLFVAGTASLLLNHLITTLLLIRSPNYSLQMPFWQHPDLFVQMGVVFDLIFFALGISYRHRREAVRKAVVEQQLAREREQHQREHLEAALSLERLKQEKTEVQMRALQSQINPHFLFNSLTSLSSLIDESPRQAGDFVDELSSVYRYLLRTNDSELTTVGMELRFIQSYFHLLKTRYGQRVCPEMAVPDTYLEALIPPLTLQLLVENAVKHNIALPDQPLTIRIGITPDGQLLVENNVQRRTLRVESNGVGLSNITDKYRLLNRAEPRIEEVDGWFRVTLPLLHTQQAVRKIDR